MSLRGKFQQLGHGHVGHFLGKDGEDYAVVSRADLLIQGVTEPVLRRKDGIGGGISFSQQFLSFDLVHVPFNGNTLGNFSHQPASAEGGAV